MLPQPFLPYNCHVKLPHPQKAQSQAPHTVGCTQKCLFNRLGCLLQDGCIFEWEEKGLNMLSVKWPKTHLR